MLKIAQSTCIPCQISQYNEISKSGEVIQWKVTYQLDPPNVACTPEL